MHSADFQEVIKRAHYYGVEKMLFAAGYIEDALISYNLSTTGPDYYSTIGVHPCRANECKDDVEGYFKKIRATI